jgi:dienelactone hydrolase
MKRVAFSLLALLVIGGCGSKLETKTGTLLAARQGFQTKLLGYEAPREPVEEPPRDIFQIVQYESPVGKLPAYLSPDPKDGKKHPVIIWITGGDCNSIGDVWSPAPADNDQSARAFREAGILMMFPSLRGGNENPGVKEGYLHEVDDILAAADYLAKQDFIDSGRIYLGGHSTGGTLALLTAEISPRFRGVFSFGPISDVRRYSSEYVPFDATIREEWEIRAPALWLHCIKSPVFIFEGTDGNIADLQTMQSMTTDPNIHFHPIEGASHFSILAPVTRIVARKVVKDDGNTCNIGFTEEELEKAKRR